MMAARAGCSFSTARRQAFKAAAAKSEILTDNGCELRTVEGAELAKIDPALEPVLDQIAGGLYAPDDESGDARMFTQDLADWCAAQRHHLQIWHHHKQYRNRRRSGHRHCHIGRATEVCGRIYVLCLGVYSPHLARHLGDDLPIYPVKGYSMTIPVAGHNNPPAIGGVDEENLVAYCPMGDRLRLTATAEFSGYSNAHTPSDFRHMIKVAKTLFPSGGDFSQATYWAGLRPMTPEGTPIFGQGRHDEPLVQHRSGAHGLDHVPRLGADHRRPHRRQGARHRPGGHDARQPAMKRHHQRIIRPVGSWSSACPRPRRAAP